MTSAAARRRRVLMIITKAEAGGAQKHVHDLAVSLARDMCQEVHVAVGERGWLTEALDSAGGVSLHVLRHLQWLAHPGTDVLGLFELRRLIRSLAPDIVHAHSFKAGALGRLACVGLPVKVVFTAHGWVFTPGSGLWRRALGTAIELFLSWLTDRIIVVSQFDLALAARRGISRRKLVLVRNGLPGVPAAAVAEKLATIGVGEGVRFVMVARFAPPKEQGLVMDALAALDASERKRLSMTFVGDGPERAKAVRQAQYLRLGDCVRFAGSVRPPEVERFLLDAHVLVLASRYEGRPLSVLEAMSAGCAILASRTGALVELLEETGSAVIVENRVEAWAAGFRAILGKDDGLGDMCARSRKAFEDSGMLERQVGSTVAVYESVGSASAS